MKIKKKIIVPIVSILILGLVGALVLPKIVNGASSKNTIVATTPLEKMNLQNLVSVTGTVKSQDMTNVYSTLAYQVQDVKVEVGDVVKAGDILCVLDTADLKAKIAQQEITLGNSQAKAQHNLSVAQNNLNTEKFNQEKNYDAQLQSADKGVEQAEQNLVSRQSALDSAILSRQSAEQSLRLANRSLQDYKDTIGVTENQFVPAYEQLRQSVIQGGITVDKAENAVKDAQKAVDEAKKAIADAKESRETVKVQKQEALVQSQQQVKSAELNTNFGDAQMQMDELKKDLDEANIKAPVGGTVTAVLATQGSSGQGLLFVIENTSNLKIATKIKEYDVAAVKVGQPAKIKSDGTGENEYDGKVIKIAPTAIKDLKGGTVETTDVQFATEVGVNNAADLRIGMNARIDIITEEKNDVYAVPFDAVVQNEKGESVVFVARPAHGGNMPNGEKPKDVSAPDPNIDTDTAKKPDENGIKVKKKGEAPAMTAVSIPVKTGMETDIYIEITSDALKEGDMIISNPIEIKDGQAVSLGGAMAGGAGGQNAGGQGGGRRGGPAMRIG